MGGPERAAPNNLPAPVTSFVGREREVVEVCRLLGGTRLLTLTGAGGCGKSRLGVEVAAAVLNDFPDGVWVAELAALTDGSLIPQVIAAALGLPERPDRSPAGELVAYLRPKSLLLVLDNCEHLTACAHLADTLLRSSPGLRLLATSREGLGVAGETLWRVPSLSVPPAASVASDELAQYESVRLFTERAAAVRPDFRVTAENAPAVAQICRRLDGMALAIELAAARISALTAEQIGPRLDDRFRLLTGGSRTALPRHRTLRAAMDWSYDLLSERERTVLDRLSVFAGGWTLEAAEAVCGGDGVESPDVLDALTSLVNKSLVNVETPGTAARYRLLETVRQYARERLQERGDADTTRGRHRDWYLAIAEAARPRLRGPDEALWLQRLELEHDNLRTALEWCMTEPRGIEAGLRLAGALGDFMDAGSHYAEGRACLHRLLTLDPGASPAARMLALHAAASVAKHQGDREDFSRHARELFTLAQDLQSEWGMGWACHYLMHVADSENDYPKAADLMERGLALSRRIGDQFGTISLLTCGGDVERGQGHYELATALLDEARVLCDALGSKRSRIAPLHNLAYVLQHQGDEKRAAALFQEGLALACELGITRNIVCCLAGVAGVCAGAAPERAARLFGAADALRAAAGLSFESVDQTDIERNIARVREHLGDEAFRRAWTAGQAMPFGDVVETALAAPDETEDRTGRKAAAPAANRGHNGLTPREREVASLVAEGLSNREIATRLVIAERTAEGHVQSIFNKLGFKSRAQIAAWAARQPIDKTPA